MCIRDRLYTGRLNEQEKITLEYLSKTILSGARPFELEILRPVSYTHLGLYGIQGCGCGHV